MTQTYSSEIPSPTQLHSCECYKKLHAFGIPLYITEEDDLYSESSNVVPYENVFQLPGILKLNEDVSEYPVVEENELFFVFERMAQIFPNLSDFEQNVISFWILDVFIEGLWTAQNAKMNHGHQKATLMWIAYLFNYVQKQNPSRKDLFQHLKAVLFKAECPGESVGEAEKRSVESEGNESGEKEIPSSKQKKIWRLPLPPDLPKSENDSKSFSTEGRSTNENETEETEKSSPSTDSEAEKEEYDTEVNLKHMNIILEILYRIFARLWVFLELQTVLHAMPPVEQVDLPFTLKIPKPLFRPEPSVQTKVEKGGKRPSFSEKSFEEIETERQLRKNDYILPLQVAEESKLYLKQFSGQPASDRSVLNRNREDRTKK